MYASVAISSGLSEVEMSVIFFSMSLMPELAEISRLVVLELVELEAEGGVEDESSCAVVIKELMPTNGDNIKIPIKNIGRITFLLTLMPFDNATNT